MVASTAATNWEGGGGNTDPSAIGADRSVAASAGVERRPDLELLLETVAGAGPAKGRSNGGGGALPASHVDGGNRAEELRTRGTAVAAAWRNPSKGCRVSEGEER